VCAKRAPPAALIAATSNGVTQARLDPPIEVQTAENVSAAVIWLHGLGADGNDFAGVVPELRLPGARGVRFIFPHAPYRPVTINNGYIMRAWYDLAWDERGFRQDATHIAESVRELHGLIERERERGIAAERIVLAGFSQGGVMALHSALRYPKRLGGGVVLSAPAVYLDDLLAEATAVSLQLPLLVAHGRRDPVVPFALGQKARDALRARGYPVEWHEYEMEHSVCWEEVVEVGRFIGKVLG
jgi:phospholipase/carboxylesterase